MLHENCMDFMATLPDKAFELAIVDPPYGIGEAGGELHSNRALSGAGKLKNRALNTGNTKWDSAPSAEYFAELLRVSENQIIWGGNYFPLPPSRCVIAWDKVQPWENFSQWEMAWTSFDFPAALFRFDNRTGGKIHPTAKPVALYKWLLSRYAKPGNRILDTHGGSGSICIACHDLGFDLTWMELDADYYEAAVKRYKTHAAQGQMFIHDNPKPVGKELEL
jgi:site-specific DNA-methyltransferase (adenine-specific)